MIPTTYLQLEYLKNTWKPFKLYLVFGWPNGFWNRNIPPIDKEVLNIPKQNKACFSFYENSLLASLWVVNRHLSFCNVTVILYLSSIILSSYT
jgi:hypothetical protein